MNRRRTIRGVLWAAAALNLVGVLIFGTAALDTGSGALPIPVPRFYAAQIALTIGLFGGVYAYLAGQLDINLELVVVGALGKIGFFSVTVLYWAAGDLPASAVPQAIPDLVLAAIFIWWVRTTTSRVERPAEPVMWI